MGGGCGRGCVLFLDTPRQNRNPGRRAAVGWVGPRGSRLPEMLSEEARRCAPRGTALQVRVEGGALQRADKISLPGTGGGGGYELVQEGGFSEVP